MYLVRKISKFSFIFLLAFFFTLKANALSIYYDIELDNYIKNITKDLLKNSDLEDVKIYIADNNEVNAFAMQGNIIVINSGLIERSQYKGHLQGVIAHELSHLIAQHHIKSLIKQQDVSFESIAGAALGVGAIIAGSPQAGGALLLGGGAASLSRSLSYTRAHENEADKIAVNLMDESSVDKAGLAGFFKILGKQESGLSKKVPDYLKTHPNTSSRKQLAQNYDYSNDKSITSDKPFNIFKAKVYALSNDAKKVLKYQSYNDDASKYLAYAIAYNKQGQFKNSIRYLNKSKMSGLPEALYDDQLGQILYENAKFGESISYFKNSQSTSWINDFQIGLSYKGLKDYKKARFHFRRAYAKFEDFYFTLKQLGEVNALLNKKAQGHYYLGLYYFKVSDNKNAKLHLKIADKYYNEEKLSDDILQQNIAELRQFISKKVK